MASLNKTLAALGNRPSITAGAGLGFKNGLFTVDNTDLNALELNWNVGVALNVPIFDGFMTANRRAEAEGSLAAAKDEVENLRRTIEAQVVQAIRSLAASRSRVENSADQLTADQASPRHRQSPIYIRRYHEPPVSRFTDLIGTREA